MSAALRALESVKDAYGPGCAERKLALLKVLARQRLASARAVERLHEALCFLRAYPDDERVLSRVERLLSRFSRRSDLARHRDALADSGIDSTAIRYRFFWPTARWIAGRWPERLELDPDDDEAWARIASDLPLLVTRAQADALRALDLPPREALARVKGRDERDAVFLVRRIGELPGDDFTREALHDGIDASYVLRPGPGTPSRTLAKEGSVAVVAQRTLIRRDRPDLRTEIPRPPASVRLVEAREGRRLIELARGAMITRKRDLDAFAYGDPRDVRVVEDGDGLAFVAIGVVPERRALLPAIYGYLTLRSGVPIGYVQTDGVGGWAAVSFNTFDTYRGGEAAWVFARVLAMTRHLFGATSFSIEPYQLGKGNAEGIDSGAWWFYYKMGFRPRNPAVATLARREAERVKARRTYRTSLATLKQLVCANLFFFLDRERQDVIGLVPADRVALAASDLLGSRFASSRERATAALADEAAERLEAGPWRQWPDGERLWWERWAPIVALLDTPAWSPVDRAALVEVIRAKGSRREGAFVTRFDSHAVLRQGILALMK